MNVQHIMEDVAEVLGIDVPANIVITLDNPLYLGSYASETDTLTINSILLFNQYWLEYTIAHEMRHRWQYITKLLVTEGDTADWLCSRFVAREEGIHDIYEESTGKHIPYAELPWEVDANEFATRYMKQLYKLRA